MNPVHTSETARADLVEYIICMWIMRDSGPGVSPRIDGTDERGNIPLTHLKLWGGAATGHSVCHCRWGDDFGILNGWLYFVRLCVCVVQSSSMLMEWER